jgi:hypothetical protein
MLISPNMGLLATHDDLLGIFLCLAGPDGGLQEDL